MGADRAVNGLAALIERNIVFMLLIGSVLEAGAVMMRSIREAWTLMDDFLALGGSTAR